MQVHVFPVKVVAPLMMVGLIWTAGCEKSESSKFVKSERQRFAYAHQGNADFGTNSPTIVGDYIYIGTSMSRSILDITTGNSFYKFNKSLNKIWEYALGDYEVKGGAALDAYGNIYFVAGLSRMSYLPDDDTKLYSLDNNGNLRWKVVIDSVNEPESRNVNPGISNPAISKDNTIYVGGDDFYAFDINGNLEWMYEVDDDYNFGKHHTTTSPIIDPAGNIYFVASKRDLISLDKYGNERWRALTDMNNDGNFNAWLSSPAFSDDYSKIYLPTLDKIHCVSANTGTVIWTFSPPDMTGYFRGTPAVDDQNNIYIGTHGSYAEDDRQMLYAIKADGSGLLWQNNIGSDMYSSPALGNDRILYIGCEDYRSRDGYKRLHAIDMSTGSKIWSASIETSIIWGSAAISDDGVLYIGSMYMDNDRWGTLYGFQTDCTGLLNNAGSPRFHEGNANTGRRD